MLCATNQSMEKVLRKGIAFDPNQLKQFDNLIKKKKYKSRSEAIRDMIRKEIIEEQQENPESEMIATLTIIYEHHEHHVQDELTYIQHHYHALIISSIHVHIDHCNCLEVIVLEGKVKDIRKIADEIIANKGVKHGKLFLSSIN